MILGERKTLTLQACDKDKCLYNVLGVVIIAIFPQVIPNLSTKNTENVSSPDKGGGEGEMEL
jgi:hypothetical protein